MPECPLCKKPLQRVTNTGGWMNSDQFDAVRAGDWFCECRAHLLDLSLLSRGTQHEQPRS